MTNIAVPPFVHPVTVSKEYTLNLHDEALKIFLNDRRLHSIGVKTNCKIELTNRILHRRIAPYKISKFVIVRITGPGESSLKQCNKLIETIFPIYGSRKHYSIRAPVLSNNSVDKTIPDKPPQNNLNTQITQIFNKLKNTTDCNNEKQIAQYENKEVHETKQSLNKENTVNDVENQIYACSYGGYRVLHPIQFQEDMDSNYKPGFVTTVTKFSRLSHMLATSVISADTTRTLSSAMVTNDYSVSPIYSDFSMNKNYIMNTQNIFDIVSKAYNKPNDKLIENFRNDIYFSKSTDLDNNLKNNLITELDEPVLDSATSPKILLDQVQMNENHRPCSNNFENNNSINSNYCHGSAASTSKEHEFSILEPVVNETKSNIEEYVENVGGQKIVIQSADFPDTKFNLIPKIIENNMEQLHLVNHEGDKPSLSEEPEVHKSVSPRGSVLRLCNSAEVDDLFMEIDVMNDIKCEKQTSQEFHYEQKNSDQNEISSLTSDYLDIANLEYAVIHSDKSSDLNKISQNINSCNQDKISHVQEELTLQNSHTSIVDTQFYQLEQFVYQDGSSPIVKVMENNKERFPLEGAQSQNKIPITDTDILIDCQFHEENRLQQLSSDTFNIPYGVQKNQTNDLKSLSSALDPTQYIETDGSEVSDNQYTIIAELDDEKSRVSFTTPIELHANEMLNHETSLYSEPDSNQNFDDLISFRKQVEVSLFFKEISNSHLNMIEDNNAVKKPLSESTNLSNINYFESSSIDHFHDTNHTNNLEAILIPVPTLNENIPNTDSEDNYQVQEVEIENYGLYFNDETYGMTQVDMDVAFEAIPGYHPPISPPRIYDIDVNKSDLPSTFQNRSRCERDSLISCSVGSENIRHYKERTSQVSKHSERTSLLLGCFQRRKFKK